MRFYKQQHRFYSGVDLHAKTMHICLVNQAGEVLVHCNLKTEPKLFLDGMASYRYHDLVIGVECMFTWYWQANLCTEHNITFVLGRALYMKAIHGGKAKNDKIDSEKIAMLLRGRMLPQAYVYPEKMRSTRDLLRRRMHSMHQRSEALAHISIHLANTTYHYSRRSSLIRPIAKELPNNSLTPAHSQSSKSTSNWSIILTTSFAA